MLYNSLLVNYKTFLQRFSLFQFEETLYLRQKLYLRHLTDNYIVFHQYCLVLVKFCTL